MDTSIIAVGSLTPYTQAISNNEVQFIGVDPEPDSVEYSDISAMVLPRSTETTRPAAFTQ